MRSVPLLQYPIAARFVSGRSMRYAAYICPISHVISAASDGLGEPMAISVSCPSCARVYNVKHEAAGKKFKCKDCEAVVEVPAGDSSGASAPFADEFGDPYNPYADDQMAGAPRTVAPGRAIRHSSGSSATVAARCTAPGIALMVVGALVLMGVLGYVGLSVAVIIANPPPDLPAEAKTFMVAWMVGLTLYISLFAGLVIAGGNALRKQSSYGLAMTGSIIAVIPCLSTCLCLPFGIWALVVLNDPDVKAAFR
jgi:hypothetical protein